ncbi:hypothetical protein TSUD_147500 [Trifolium subterraneum]|uniref:Uncharacterized protein n=1 Tax=Trifolium subterraneum TaxID=3900 RepID=A0A2Z6NPD4_TRISU|nr:hypothetical protein TSUD_147500 [Trifolium subterraneum]
MLNNGGLVVSPSDSGHSYGMNKSFVDESKGEDVTALDVQTIERSNENFSLGKLFHNFRQGLGLSVLALMMIGATIINLPMHDLRFKKSTATNEIITNKLLKSHWISSNKVVLKVNILQLQRSPRNRNVSQ